MQEVLGKYDVAARQVPQVLHDVVVLCYRNLPENTEIKMKRGSDVIAEATGASTWILYANEEQYSKDPHKTVLNDYMSFRAGGTGGDLKLSTPFGPDGPPVTTIGMSSEHLRFYFELPKSTGLTMPHLRTDGGSICTRLIVG